jgi:hypothetical protein
VIAAGFEPREERAPATWDGELEETDELDMKVALAEDDDFDIPTFLRPPARQVRHAAANVRRPLPRDTAFG